MDTVDAQKNIVDPAVNGTRAFLSACAAAGSVRKVVLTSSAAAVADRGRPGPAYTEEDWNTKSSIDFLPYFYSKVQAERAAWAWAEEHPDIKLVVINPFIVCGPSMVGGVNPSNELLRSMASGGFPGVVDLTLTLVDVRDVSKAHILALESDTAKGRYICCASEKPMHMRDVVKVLDSLGFPTKQVRLRATRLRAALRPARTNASHLFSLTRTTACSLLAAALVTSSPCSLQMDLTNAFVTKTMRFLTGFSGKADMQYMHGHIGNPNLQNNAKIVADLGMTFMDPEDTIKDAMADMAKWGHLPPPKAD